MKTPKGGGSASKVDLLKSALEINHKTSNSGLMGGVTPSAGGLGSNGSGGAGGIGSGRLDKTSNQSLNKSRRADSAPKLNHNNAKNHPALCAVVDEVIYTFSHYSFLL